MTQNPTSHRKATSSFISDSSNLNPVQVSPRGHKPHSEQRSPFTMANKNSKTNFITDSFLFEGPRAVAVSETGEKHFIEVDDEEFSKSCSNPFTLSSNISTTNHHVSMSSMPKILERSSHSEMEKSIKQQNDISESNCKVVKKSKNHRSRVHQRNRLQFTPRNAERTSSASLILKTVKTQSTQPTISKINKNTETQTETPRFSSISVATPIYNGTNMERRMQMSIVKPPLLNESINRPQIFVPTLQQAPLKIYTKSNSDLDIYSGAVLHTQNGVVNFCSIYQ